jgi:hypothetical protein
MAGALVLPALLFSAWWTAADEPSADASACTCAQARLRHQWCAACKVGYVAGLRIESHLLFEEIDSHGHDVDPARIECPSCRKALAVDGFCERCTMGFVHKQAYMSRLTYYVAKGETKDIDKIACPSCRENSQTHGWCDACGVGMVGNVAFKVRDDFEPAAKAYGVLCEAVRTLKRCESCAVAMVLDGHCPFCKLTYRNGAKVEAAPSP